MWSRWMSSSFWYQTGRNRLINNHLNGDRYVFNSCQWSRSTVQRKWKMSRSVCWWMVTFATFKNVPVSIQIVRSYLSTKSYKFGIKMKKTSTCLLWYAFNWPNIKHFWKTWTFRSVQKLFFRWVYIMYLVETYDLEHVHLVSIFFLKSCLVQ